MIPHHLMIGDLIFESWV